MPPQLVFKTMNAVHNTAYRLSGGRLGKTMKGAPVMLLTTTGRKSGNPRTSPVLYVRDGDRIAIVASKGGAPQHPSWYGNLRADPEVGVQIGKEKRRMHARDAEGDERERLWRAAVAVYPPFEDYTKRTTRQIPVVVLEAPDEQQPAR